MVDSGPDFEEPWVLNCLPVSVCTTDSGDWYAETAYPGFGYIVGDAAATAFDVDATAIGDSHE